jgi:hypothetical protein
MSAAGPSGRLVAGTVVELSPVLFLLLLEHDAATSAAHAIIINILPVLTWTEPPASSLRCAPGSAASASL